MQVTYTGFSKATKTAVTIALAALLLQPLVGYAMPIVHSQSCVNSTNLCATGVDDLRADGITYRVNFVWGSFEEAYGTADPLFLGHSEQAEQAAAVLLEALLSEPRTFGIVAEPGARLPFSSAATIPVNLRTQDALGFAVRAASNRSPIYQLSFGPAELQKADLLQGSFNTWAVFTEVPTVPEPGMAALLCLGFVALTRRRRNLDSQVKS